MNIIQKGGLDPLIKVPKFKYTFNEGRKLLIGTIYPYADYLIECVVKMPYESYSYNGFCECKVDNSIPDEEGFNPNNTSNIEEKIFNCESVGHPVYWFVGGTVYEMLKKKFSNVNLYDYCDATGDIDVTLNLPALVNESNHNEELELDIPLLNKSNKLASFYNHFTSWAFENLVKNFKKIELLFKNIDDIVEFDINDYKDIIAQHKVSDLGYKYEKVGKMYVVAFLAKTTDNIKVQIVCKVQNNNISIIDHVLEIMIAEHSTVVPLSYKWTESKPQYTTITLNGNNYNIQNYNKLIENNISAYLERKGTYGSSNVFEHIHKSINHIARLFYLYELFYNNQISFDFKKFDSLLFFHLFIAQKNREQLEFLYYYKIIDEKFYTIKVNTKFFLNAYYEIINLQDKYPIMIFSSIYGKDYNYFINYPNVDLNLAKNLHDEFINKLFDNDLFQKNDGLLTFNETMGGKNRNKKYKNKRKSKKTKNSKKRRKSIKK
jgi:hypothetical protein